mmetsp:Transcript_25737/g.74377  ORF Transcript_25737/g.74377 Transcript_25737/m.74377 type:complete len:201 (+) Transcript_25737:210-812(+)
MAHQQRRRRSARGLPQNRQGGVRERMFCVRSGGSFAAATRVAEALAAAFAGADSSAAATAAAAAATAAATAAAVPGAGASGAALARRPSAARSSGAISAVDGQLARHGRQIVARQVAAKRRRPPSGPARGWSGSRPRPAPRRGGRRPRRLPVPPPNLLLPALPPQERGPHCPLAREGVARPRRLPAECGGGVGRRRVRRH